VSRHPDTAPAREDPRGPDAEPDAESLAVRLCPVVLPCALGTPAAFTHAGFNGRTLDDDLMDVMLTLMTNTPLGDGVRPDSGSFLDEFPYLGVPTSSRTEATSP
jgi:hypothetical protein